MGCTIIGSLVDAIAQIAFSEGMAEIVIAITAIPIAIPVIVVVIIPTTIMTTVSALMVV